MNNFKRALLIALSMSAFSLPANATVYDGTFTGTVNFTSGNGLGFSIGDPITGSLSYDSANMTQTTSGQFPTYSYFGTSGDSSAVLTMTDEVSDTTVTLTGAGSTEVSSGPGATNWTFGVQDGEVTLGLGPGDNSFLINLTDIPDAVDYSSAAVDFSYTAAQLQNSDASAADLSGNTFDVALTSLAVGPANSSAPSGVPAPGAFALLGLGLIGLGGMRRERKVA